MGQREELKLSGACPGMVSLVNGAKQDRSDAGDQVWHVVPGECLPSPRIIVKEDGGGKQCPLRCQVSLNLAR